MTRTGVNIMLVGLLIAGLGGAAYLLVMVVPNLDFVLFETVVLFCWGIGAALILVGALVAAVGTSRFGTARK
jgi:hypothetical protein